MLAQQFPAVVRPNSVRPRKQERKLSVPEQLAVAGLVPAGLVPAELELAGQALVEPEPAVVPVTQRLMV